MDKSKSREMAERAWLDLPAREIPMLPERAFVLGFMKGLQAGREPVRSNPEDSNG